MRRDSYRNALRATYRGQYANKVIYHWRDVSTLNGVKQGGVISSILFCIYIDEIFASLSQLGVGCYIAGNFVGAIVYADQIVLISPTPLGMRKLLLTCDSYANEFDIIFNAILSRSS